MVRDPQVLLTAWRAAEDPQAKFDLWAAYRRSVNRSLDVLLPDDCKMYWPDSDDTLWPREGDYDPTPWVVPEEFRRRSWEDSGGGYPAYAGGRLRMKAAIQRYLTNRGNTEEARATCKEILAFAWKRERKPPDSQVWWTLLYTCPEALRFAPTRPTRSPRD